MYERFTAAARNVMQLANQEAQRLNHEYVGTEHILLGLVKERAGVAAIVLKNLVAPLDDVRVEIEKIVHCGLSGTTMAELPHTPRAKKCLELAIEEALDLNHRYVGTEHLFLGVLRVDDGVAAQALLNLGLKPEDVRIELQKLLEWPTT